MIGSEDGNIEKDVDNDNVSIGLSLIDESKYNKHGFSILYNCLK